jgi:tetratricopeptide (TPR) repeat protein
MLWDASTSKNNLPVFIDLARKATALRPDVGKNWERLAWHLLRTGKDDEAIAVLSEAVSKLPREPRLHLMLADAYYRTRRFDLVDEILQSAPAIPIDDRETTIYRLELQMETRAAKDAAELAADTLALDPTHQEALNVLGNASRENGRPETMIPFCQTALKHAPWHTRARFELAAAFAMLGRSEEARQLIDLNQFVTVTEVATPEGYVNAEAFEAALAGEIARNPTLKPDPVGKSTTGGLQTMAALPHAGERAISVVLDLIRLAVDAFEANLPEGLEDTFVKRRPKRACLNAWAVVYPGDGHQSTHIHPYGWLSGTYYVSVPKTSCEDSHGGCLVLGTLEEMKGLSVDPPWGIQNIRPVPGRLVLFPSYIPHATIPTRSTDRRICISFDVCPVGSDPPSDVVLYPIPEIVTP